MKIFVIMYIIDDSGGTYTKPNKIAIRAAIKEGKEITGAQLVKKVSLYVK